MRDGQSPGDRAPRILLNAPIGIELEDGSGVSATLLDLSGGGFRIRTEELLQVGEKLVLTMDGEAPMPGEVKWVTGFVAGGIFLVGPGPVG